MKNKKISVLTTLYNHEAYIKETLESAITQYVEPDEVVVIDDASSDGSADAAESIAHPAICVIREPYNLGGAATMKGLAACTGDFVAILNSDDAWEKDKLGQQLEYMEKHPECGVVFTRVKLIDARGRPIPGDSHRLSHVFSAANRERADWIRYFFHQGNAFCVSSAFIRRECLDRIGPLNGKFIQLQDFDFWFRAVLAGFKLHVLEDQLTRYRVMGGANMSVPSSANLAVFELEYARVFRHLWQVETLDELSSLFPEVVIHPEADDRLTLFYLARLAAAQGTPHHRLFASETLFEWGADERAMRQAQVCHGFGLREYAAMMADTPLRHDLAPAVKTFIKTRAAGKLPRWLYRMLMRATRPRNSR